MNDVEFKKRFKAIQQKHQQRKNRGISEYYYKELKPRIEAKANLDDIKTLFPKDDNICNMCGKTLKNAKGVKIHKGKVHKQTNNKESLSFDDNGKYVNGKVNKVLNDYPKPKTKKLDQEKREFWCSKHKRFHKHRFHGNISKTYQKCLRNKDNFYKFKINIDQYEIYTLKIHKAVKRYSVKSHKRTSGSRKQ